jgi:hypothetical protein
MITEYLFSFPAVYVILMVYFTVGAIRTFWPEKKAEHPSCTLSTWYRKYRIVHHTNGNWFRVQVWRVWFPVWVPVRSYIGTSEEARSVAYKHRFDVVERL